MTATTATLTDFLLARIAEDEELARLAAPDGEELPWLSPDMGGPHVAMPQARVLAECEAKRRIVECASASVRRPIEGARDPAAAFGRVHDAATVLQALALPYADHPDYRPEWRP